MSNVIFLNLLASIPISSALGVVKGCVSVGGNDLAATHPVTIPATKRNIIEIIERIFICQTYNCSASHSKPTFARIFFVAAHSTTCHGVHVT